MQNSPHVPRVVLDPGKLLDERGDSRQRPQLSFEAMSPRPKAQRGLYTGQLLCIESGLSPGAPRSLELFRASLQEAQKPPAYTLTADAE